MCAAARRLVVALTVSAALIALGGGPAAYGLTTAGHSHGGGVPAAGPPTHRGISALRPYRARLGGGERPRGERPGGERGAGRFPGPGGERPGPPRFPGAGGPGEQPAPGGVPGIGQIGRPPSAPRGGSAAIDPALVTLLEQTDTTWAAATTGAQTAAPLELVSGKAVIAIGGFSGGDPAPTLAQFQRYVANGQVRYFIAVGPGGFGGPGGPGSGGAIAAWVAANFTATTVGGTTVYDLAGVAR
jgi:hypothetical protein